ncbi:GCN5-related N-acetyltransferase [Carbonactinospora thermoautotrophica]|uniref:GCN5-related N-acetyltransferase n=1 Tax=Carbonactinospora thermoautotrophica TaxID=1469144 RepID=A0A132MTH7_9ACTN|nr:helix-turn-helix domain-containing GNAT family N-acetyltransferase [Carbonactinospora thermoautotrophica]KWX00682.1 GCN5-related N-acetyltransferase [Carbonactinospora thermoautotrophica]
MKSPETLEERVDAVRAFTRFYTNLTGVLREGLLHTPYSLTEARVIFELAQRDATEIATLRRTLDIDSGYLSRILARFAADGLITKERSRTDARRQVIRLTGQGRAAFELLDTRSAEQFRTLLARLPEEEQRRLVTAMGTIRQILEGAPRAGAFVLRPLGPGDLGWVVYRHGVRYAEEYGWDETFEALVARIVADYVDHHDPQRENAWIAEVDGEPAGCVFCVKQDDTTAKLRLLLVEPRFRGMGIGSRLVEECIRFARRAGYREMVLWTNDVLVQARRIYERAGFELVEEEKHHSFGQDLVGQTWRRALAP